VHEPDISPSETIRHVLGMRPEPWLSGQDAILPSVDCCSAWVTRPLGIEDEMGRSRPNAITEQVARAHHYNPERNDSMISAETGRLGVDKCQK
jgi:hypothetical protein